MDGCAGGRPLEGLIVDNFAGGGGASTGIEAALGRPIDIAINHSPQAIAMHTANHPHTQHLCEDVWQVDPAKACAGRPGRRVEFPALHELLIERVDGGDHA